MVNIQDTDESILVFWGKAGKTNQEQKQPKWIIQMWARDSPQFMYEIRSSELKYNLLLHNRRNICSL